MVGLTAKGGDTFDLPPFAFERPGRMIVELDHEPSGTGILAMQESGWQQHVVSPAGAVGVTQLLLSTAEWLVRDFLPDAIHWRTDARHNARLGALQMWLHLRSYGCDLDTSLAAYYQGAGNVARYGLFHETHP